MKKVILYIASSLDGYIAKPDGSVDWLHALPNPNQLDYGYQEFTDGIDTIIMGRKTYEEILGFDVEWPYSNFQTYIVTSNPHLKTPTENTHLMVDSLKEKVNQLKQEDGKDIFFVGGGQLVTEFLNQDLLDEITIFIMPTILGEGLSLFPNKPVERIFDLVETESFETGVVKLTYRRK